MEKKYCSWNSPWRTSQVNHSSISSNKNKLYLRYSISIKNLKISDLTVFGFNVKKCRMEIRTVTNIPGFLLGYPVSFSFFTDKNLQTENLKPRTTLNFNLFAIWLFLEILVACRLMMLGAIGCGFCGLILSVLGMKCTSIAAQRQKAKSLFALIGGLLLGVAGELNT